MATTAKSDPIGNLVLVILAIIAFSFLFDWRPDFTNFGKTWGPARSMPPAK